MRFANSARARLLGAALLASAAAVCRVAAGQAGTLAGSVVQEGEAGPAAHVWVCVTRVGDLLLATPGPAVAPRERRRLVITDGRGRFSVPDLPAGLYEVAVSADSLPPRLAPAGRPVRAAIASQDDRADVELAITERATLDGAVRRRGGGALVHARVEAFHRGDPTPFAQTRSDTRGRFLLAGFEPDGPVDLVVTGPEGLFRRLGVTPRRAGLVPVETELPSWDSVTKRRVVILVSVPVIVGQRLELEWISRPEGAREGFGGVFALDRDGRCEFDSPIGLFQVRVREVESGGRCWIAPRLVRVDPGAEPMTARIEVEQVP